MCWRVVFITACASHKADNAPSSTRKKLQDYYIYFEIMEEMRKQLMPSREGGEGWSSQLPRVDNEPRNRHAACRLVSMNWHVK